MKHISFLFCIATLIFSASCSGEGAYSEEEKQMQDSTDSARQESDFEKLEKENVNKPDSAVKTNMPAPNKDQPVEEPKVIIEAEEVK